MMKIPGKIFVLTAFAVNLILFFLVTQFVLAPELSINFWLVLIIFSLFTAYSLIRGLHSASYYGMFFVFTIIFGYFIGSAIGVRYLLYSGNPDPIQDTIVTISLVHVVGLLIGIRLNRKRKEGHLTSNRGPSRNNIVPILFSVFLTMVFAFGLFGVSGFLALRLETYLSEPMSAYKHFAYQALKLAPYFASTALLQYAVSRRPSANLFKLALFFVLSIALLVSNPTNTARFISLTAISIFFVSYISFRKKTDRLLWYLQFFPILSIVLLPLTSTLRSGYGGLVVERLFKMYSSLEFSSLQMLTSGVSVIEELGRNNVISGIFIFVPRAIWGGKAPSLGISIAERSGFVFTNSAVPTFFAAYVDAGYLGLLLFSIIAGYVLSWAQIPNGINWSRRKDFFRVAVFSLVPIFARGDFSTFMISLYAIIAAYEFTRFFSRFSMKRQTTRLSS